MVLNENQIQDRMHRLVDWEREGGTLTRAFRLPSFPMALAFISAVGYLAESADHHPAITLNYRNVTVTLSTHSAGGLTEKDFALAGQINALPMMGH